MCATNVTSLFATILALKEAFCRQHATNMTSLLTTILVFFVVIHFQGFRVELAVKCQNIRGQMVGVKSPLKLEWQK